MVIGLWLFSSVTAFMLVFTLGILLPVITEDFDLSPIQQGILGSAPFWGNIALSIPLSWWASRFGPKGLTTVTMMMGTACLFFQSWAPIFIVLLLGRLIFGIAISAQQPARVLLTQQWFRPREVILVNGLSNVLFGLVVGGGLVASPFILGALDDDWRATFRTFGFIFAALTLLWMLLGRERVTSEFRRREIPRESGLVKAALSHRDLWFTGIGFLGATMAFSAFLSFYPSLMLNSYELPLGWSGGILALGVAVGGVTGLPIGYIAAQKAMEKVFLQALGVLMAGTYVGMIMTGSIPTLMVLSFINGVAWGFFPILLTVPYHLPGIRPREVAVAVAFIFMMTSIGTALGPLITGFLDEAFNDLKLALMLLSFASLSLLVAGIVLRYGATGSSRPESVANP